MSLSKREKKIPKKEETISCYKKHAQVCASLDYTRLQPVVSLSGRKY